MTDIFDEKKDIKNLRSFVAFLRDKYEVDMHERHHAGVKERIHIDPEEVRIRSRLVTHWPGDEIVMQIIKDAAKLMVENDVSLRDLI